MTSDKLFKLLIRFPSLFRAVIGYGTSAESENYDTDQSMYRNWDYADRGKPRYVGSACGP